MKRFAVSHIHLMDNDLKSELIEADFWYEALCIYLDYDPELDIKDIEKAKSEAFDQDWLFDVLEIL